MMKHPVVLDACTIINLLRIDDEDEFIFKSLMSLDFSIPHIVYEEVNINIKKNSLSDAQKKYIERVIPYFLSHSIQKDVIIKDLSEDYFDELCKFVKHTKKLNGELFSSALSLCISRERETKVYFYTDDFPAKEQFAPFFSCQQIGVIGDSIDLLIFLYWVKADFDEKRFKKILQDLKSEYNIPLKQLINKIQVKKDSIFSEKKIDRLLTDNLDKILTGYLQANPQLMIDGLSFFDFNSKYSEIKAVIKQFPNIQKECLLSKKIQCTMDYLSSYSIYKIA